VGGYVILKDIVNGLFNHVEQNDCLRILSYEFQEKRDERGASCPPFFFGFFKRSPTTFNFRLNEPFLDILG